MSAIDARLTGPTAAVLGALLDNQSLGAYGLALGAEAHLPPGSLHPALARLEKLGWVESCWHEGTPGEPVRPRRRWYRLTPTGVQLARQALHQAEEARAQWVLRARPAAGAA